MDRIRIVGGRPLNGRIPISGAKNAALPLMIASLLTDRTLTLENLPRLADVNQLMRILGNHGVDTSIDGKRKGEHEVAGQTAHLNARVIVDTTAPYELVSKMRASFWVLAPLLMAMEKLGASIDIDAGYVVARAPKGLQGGEIDFPKVTVGGTHVALMAATLANGSTLITNAAREPEVVDLAECLSKMGARIKGAGTSEIEIEGVARLSGASHAVMPDRIETGTYAMAVAMTGGDVLLEGARGDLLQAALDDLAKTGVEVVQEDRGLRVRKNGGPIQPVDVTTEPFPGFPTDLQAQFMGLMTRAQGVSRIRETIFENRFMHVQELARLGAHIHVERDTAIVTGVPTLKGAPVMATDLRASVSLVIAALAAQGETIVSRVYHLDRGFEHLEKKLGACGADVERLASGD